MKKQEFKIINSQKSEVQKNEQLSKRKCIDHSRELYAIVQKTGELKTFKRFSDELCAEWSCVGSVPVYDDATNEIFEAFYNPQESQFIILNSSKISFEEFKARTNHICNSIITTAISNATLEAYKKTAKIYSEVAVAEILSNR